MDKLVQFMEDLYEYINIHHSVVISEDTEYNYDLCHALRDRDFPVLNVTQDNIKQLEQYKLSSRCFIMNYNTFTEFVHEIKDTFLYVSAIVTIENEHEKDKIKNFLNNENIILNDNLHFFAMDT